MRLWKQFADASVGLALIGSCIFAAAGEARANSFPPQCTLAATTITCDGMAASPVQLDAGFDLILNATGTIAGTNGNFTNTPAVTANGNNIVTLNGDIGNQRSFTAPAIVGGAVTVNLGDDVSAIFLGPGSTLNANAGIDIDNVLALDISNTTSTNSYYLNVVGIAIQADANTAIHNDSFTQVLASYWITATNVENFSVNLSNAVGFGVYGSNGPLTFTNGVRLMATVFQEYDFSTFTNVDLTGAVAFATGVLAPSGSTLSSDAPLNAEAISTFHFSDGTNAQLFGGYSIFTSPTTFAAGFQAFYDSDIQNRSSIFVAATTKITLNAVDNATIGTPCCGINTPQNVQTVAYGIYVGPPILPTTGAPITYDFSTLNTVDSIVNAGGIIAMATTTIQVGALTGAASVDVSSTAAGIMVAYPSFYDQGCGHGDYCGTVIGITHIQNTGDVAATAVVNYTQSISDNVPSPTLSLNLASTAIGIGVMPIGFGESQMFGGLDNSAQITALAQTTVSFAASNPTPLDVTMTLSSTAFGVALAPGLLGSTASFANISSITATALTSVIMAIQAVQPAFTLDSLATGVSLGITTDATNSGAISATSSATISIATSNNDLQSASITATAIGLVYTQNDTFNNNGAITAMANADFATAGTLPPLFSLPSVPFTLISSAYGIRPGERGTLTNTADVVAQATTSVGLPGANDPTPSGGIDALLRAEAYAINTNNLGLSTDQITVIQNGTLSAVAKVTFSASNFEFLGTVDVRAAGIWMPIGSANNTITNNLRITAAASAELIWAANYNPYATTSYFFNPNAAQVASAYGIQVYSQSTVTNNGTITVGSSVSINGTVLDGEHDPSSSYGIVAYFDSTIINKGLIETTRIGPRQWAIFTDITPNSTGHGLLLDIRNEGTTIGSIHHGEGRLVNVGTMIFRVLPSATALAALGTYDRIIAWAGTTFDTTNGTILIRPVGMPALFLDQTIYPYFAYFGATAGGIAGLSVDSHPALKSDSAFFTVSLRDTPADAPYNPSGLPDTGLDLILTRAPFSAPIDVKLVGNQRTVGFGLEGIFGMEPPVDPGSRFGQFLGTIQNLGAVDVPNAYQQLAGEVTANLSNWGITSATQLFGMVLGRPANADQSAMSATTGQRTQFASLDLAAAVTGMPDRATPGVAHWQAWMGGYGQFGRVDGDPGISGVHFNVAGAAVGLEYALRDVFRLGLALGGGATRINLRALSGHAEGQFAQAAIYGGLNLGAFYVDAAVGYARHWIDTERVVGFPGFFDRLEGKTNANQIMAGFEAGYRMKFSFLHVTPFVGAQLSSFFQDGYDEAGGPAALRYHDRVTTSFRPMVGVNLRADFKFDDIAISPYVKLAWAHELGDRASTVNTAFLAAPASTFHVYGAQRSRDSALATAGLELTYQDNIQVYAAYMGDIAARNASHAGTAGVRVRW